MSYIIKNNYIYLFNWCEGLSYSTVVLYIGIMKVWDLISPKNQVKIYFVTSKQDWLGIAKPQNVFRWFINPSMKLIWNFKNSLLAEFSTNWLADWLPALPCPALPACPACWIHGLTDSPTCWLTYLLMLSDKHYLILAIDTAFISSLFNVTSSQDVPFLQLQQLWCLHHDSTKTYLSSPLYSIPFSLTT